MKNDIIIENRKTNTQYWLILFSVVLLLLIMLFDASNAFARGRKGGGAAGALDDFDLFLQMQTTNGLPVNLVNGLESANSSPGDGTIGAGGTLPFDPSQSVVQSQGGDSVLLLPNLVNGANQPRAGMSRKLGPDGLPPMLSLKSVPIPPVPELNKFIKNRQAAILLGKALFWDMQAGSDGNACASCHFHAGADNRLINQVSSALNGNDKIFDRLPSGGGGPNYKLKPQDFPFHKLANPLDRNSALLFDSNDVVSSQGAFGGVFKGLTPNGKEICGARAEQDGFNVKGVMTRRVPARNSPTTINAVFNYRNFWDGRANNSFNGVSPFGPRDPDAKLLQMQADGTVEWVKINLRNASLASQAVGPALSDFEMSCAKRTFKDLGRKMLAARPLRLQEVDPTDSVLGASVNPDNHGLKQSYPDLIKAAFDPSWWNSAENVDGYSQMEVNFSLYWGLAIMMYESTLVSDETPFDKLVGDASHRPDPTALTSKQLRGLGIFRGKGQCLSCHKGAEFTGAATGLQPESEGTVVESMLLQTGGLGVYDSGFYNIGVRPAEEDRGVGASDPFGNPLSFTRNYFQQLHGHQVEDSVWVDPCMFSIFFDATACWTPPNPDSTRIVADGAFKTPTLRNIALTQPYFHNGSRFTLEQVVEFYNRGGDRRGEDGNDSTGFIGHEHGKHDATNGGTTNLHPSVRPLGLSRSEIDDLVDFMRHGLTDRRVACEQAPFDHPSLKLHNGHEGDENEVRDSNKDGMADDKYIYMRAVGKLGLKKETCMRNDDGSKVAGQSAIDIPPPPLPPSTGGGTTTGGTTTGGTTTGGTTTGGTTTGGTTTGGTTTGGTTTGGTTTGGTTTGASKPVRLVRANSSSSLQFTVGAVSGFSSSFGDDNKQSSKQFGRFSRGSGSAGTSTTAFNRDQNTDDSSRFEGLHAEVEKAEETSSVLAPSATLNVPEDAMVKSRVTMYGAVSDNNVFSWSQVAGTPVELSNDATLAPSFTAPNVPTTLVFELTSTNADGVSANATAIIKVVVDVVEVSDVTWLKQVGKNRLNVVAKSSALANSSPLPPPDMLMTATFWNKAIPAGMLGSATKPLELPMVYTRDLPGKPAICNSELPCFVLPEMGGIIDPRSASNAPKILAPTHVSIKSSYGGIATATGTQIHVR